LEQCSLKRLRTDYIGILVWSPLAGGFLSGKYEKNTIEL